MDQPDRFATFRMLIQSTPARDHTALGELGRWRALSRRAVPGARLAAGAASERDTKRTPLQDCDCGMNYFEQEFKPSLFNRNSVSPGFAQAGGAFGP